MKKHVMRAFRNSNLFLPLKNFESQKPLNYQAFLYENFLQQTVIYTIINAFTVTFGKILSNAYDRYKI